MTRPLKLPTYKPHDRPQDGMVQREHLEQLIPALTTLLSGYLDQEHALERCLHRLREDRGRLELRLRTVQTMKEQHDPLDLDDHTHLLYVSRRRYVEATHMPNVVRRLLAKGFLTYTPWEGRPLYDFVSITQSGRDKLRLMRAKKRSK